MPKQNKKQSDREKKTIPPFNWDKDMQERAKQKRAVLDEIFNELPEDFEINTERRESRNERFRYKLMSIRYDVKSWERILSPINWDEDW